MKLVYLRMRENARTSIHGNGVPYSSLNKQNSAFPCTCYVSGTAVGTVICSLFLIVVPIFSARKEDK